MTRNWDKYILSDRSIVNTRKYFMRAFWVLCLCLVGCASTELTESPKTAFVAQTAEAKEPKILWTSRTFSQDYDYLGVIKTRSWTYEGAVERLTRAAREIHADAVIDVHYEPVGFLSSVQAFAIKYK